MRLSALSPALTRSQSEGDHDDCLELLFSALCRKTLYHALSRHDAQTELVPASWSQLRDALYRDLDSYVYAMRSALSAG